MPKDLPPYTSSTGLFKELFKKIQEAPPPPRFSLDFLFSNLKFKKSGSTNAFIPILKRLGFLSSDGTPTDIYKKFRNPNANISGAAMSEAMQIGYQELYNRNEYWHKLDKGELKNFLIEVLELEPKSATIGYLITTIECLKSFAVFDNNIQAKVGDDVDEEFRDEDKPNGNGLLSKSAGLNLSYTINLNLPETSDIKVFDAIFKSLRENILNK